MVVILVVILVVIFGAWLKCDMVLYPDAEPVKVLWNYMNVKDLNEAIENLKAREETIKDRIGSVDLINNKSRCKVIPDIKNKIIAPPQTKIRKVIEKKLGWIR
jgi:hypothetical protein